MKKFLSLIFLIFLLSACGSKPKNAMPVDRQPNLYPLMNGATLPVNISPPTFIITDEAENYYTEIGEKGFSPEMTFNSSKGEVIPDLKQWHSLLEKAEGDYIYIRVTLGLNNGQSEELKEILCPVSPFPIDSFLVYRLLYPGYELWNEMGIYQRNLTNYNQEVVLENTAIDKQCVNCHSFSMNAPETMMIHVRGKQGGTLIRKDGTTSKVNPKCPALENGATYPSWHPSGRYIAYSANNIQQFFHAKGPKTIEVSDLSADMTIYDVDEGRAFTSSSVSGDEWMETFPNWTPDGETLYFCRAKAYKTGEALASIRYDLCSVAFDPETKEIGEPTIVFNASELGKSVSFPRVSPEGGWILFTLSDYGNFSIWHPESDLWLMNLKTGEMRPVDELNSDDVDSYHSWSSNGRWIVFSSKRMDVLWARPFIASFDPERGEFGKPFIVPQSDPLYYDDFMKTYNVPELVKSAILNTDDFVNAVGS